MGFSVSQVSSAKSVATFTPTSGATNSNVLRRMARTAGLGKRDRARPCHRGISAVDHKPMDRAFPAIPAMVTTTRRACIANVLPTMARTADLGRWGRARPCPRGISAVDRKRMDPDFPAIPTIVTTTRHAGIANVLPTMVRTVDREKWDRARRCHKENSAVDHKKADTAFPILPTMATITRRVCIVNVLRTMARTADLAKWDRARRCRRGTVLPMGCARPPARPFSAMTGA